METRQRSRVKIDLKVISKIDRKAKQKFTLARSETFEVKAVDISVLGIGIQSQYYLPQGLRVELEIDGKPFGLEKPMKIKAEIRYCLYIRSFVYRCGIKFINIPSEYQNKIGKFVDAYERRRAPRVKLSD